MKKVAVTLLAYGATLVLFTLPLYYSRIRHWLLHPHGKNCMPF